MKKAAIGLSLLFLGLIGLFIGLNTSGSEEVAAPNHPTTASSSVTNSENSASVVESVAESNANPPKATSTLPADLRVTDGRPLKKIGEWKASDRDVSGKTQLVSISSPNQDIPVGELTIHIADIKVLQLLDYSDPKNDGYDEAKKYQDDQGSFHTIQVKYKVKNPSDLDMNYLGLESLILNTGQQINLLYEELSFSRDTIDFYKKTESKEYFAIAYLEPAKVKDLKSVTIRTGTSHKKDNYVEINPSVEKTFPL